MSTTIDAGRRILDSKVGRILDLFMGAEITLDKAKSDLAEFFDQPKPSRGASDLDDYLSLLLQQAKTRKVGAYDVRADIVRIAALTQSYDPDFTPHIQRGTD